MKFFIYKMYDVNKNLLYVGKTTNLESRMTQHFAKQEVKDHPWKKDVNIIEAYETKSQSDMDILEIYCINKERPKYNVQSVTDYPTINIDYKFLNVYEMNNPLGQNNTDKLEELNVSDEDRKLIKSRLILLDKNEPLYKKTKRDKDISKYELNRMSDDEIKKINNNVYNYFRHICNLRCKNCKWTTYIEFKDKISPRGYAKGFVNQNEELKIFDNCLAYAYIRNDYPTRLQLEDEDAKLYCITYLLSVVKYITLTKGNTLHLYIPSKRIRELFEKWLNNEL